MKREYNEQEMIQLKSSWLKSSDLVLRCGGSKREYVMSFREERFCYWLESFTWGYGRLLCPLAARDLLVVVEVDIGGHPATES